MKYIVIKYRTTNYGGLGKDTEAFTLRKNGRFTKKFGLAAKFKTLDDAKEVVANLAEWSNVQYEIRRLK